MMARLWLCAALALLALQSSLAQDLLIGDDDGAEQASPKVMTNGPEIFSDKEGAFSLEVDGGGIVMHIFDGANTLDEIRLDHPATFMDGQGFEHRRDITYVEYMKWSGEVFTGRNGHKVWSIALSLTFKQENDDDGLVMLEEVALAHVDVNYDTLMDVPLKYCPTGDDDVLMCRRHEFPVKMPACDHPGTFVHAGPLSTADDMYQNVVVGLTFPRMRLRAFGKDACVDPFAKFEEVDAEDDTDGTPENLMGPEFFRDSEVFYLRVKGGIVVHIFNGSDLTQKLDDIYLDGPVEVLRGSTVDEDVYVERLEWKSTFVGESGLKLRGLAIEMTFKRKRRGKYFHLEELVVDGLEVDDEDDRVGPIVLEPTTPCYQVAYSPSRGLHCEQPGAFMPDLEKNSDVRLLVGLTFPQMHAWIHNRAVRYDFTYPHFDYRPEETPWHFSFDPIKFWSFTLPVLAALFLLWCYCEMRAIHKKYFRRSKKEEAGEQKCRNILFDISGQVPMRFPTEDKEDLASCSKNDRLD